MRSSSLMLTGLISKSDSCVIIDGAIIKTRHKSGLFVDPSQSFLVKEGLESTKTPL
ncbi:hypothetical protein Hanom_Chr06g00503911 [Helianthus anomalus]